MEEKVSKKILQQVETGAVLPDLFDTALKMVFINMEKDLVPRFNKSFQQFPDALAVNQSSQRGSVRFSPRDTHKRHFDRLVGSPGPAAAEDATSPAPDEARKTAQSMQELPTENAGLAQELAAEASAP
jgi:hypothetical protein